MSEEVIAIADVGKTNKKFILFNREYDLVFEEDVQLPQTKDDDDHPCEDINLLTKWLKDSFRQIFSKKTFDVKAVNFSSYGASLIHLDPASKPVTPLYDYMKPANADLAAEFYNKYGGKDKLCVETASPAMGFLNTGFQFYWLKYKKPEALKRIKSSLHLPQYLSYIMTKKAYSEKTSFGCHTMLWDYMHDRSHDWIYQEKLHSLFPPMVNSGMQHTITFKGSPVRCGVGMHDSSAALMPYLMQIDDPFLLISTGTWSISFNPFSKELLTLEELKQDCVMYMNYEGKPVKASRLFLGNEHDYWEKRIREHFKKDASYHKSVKLDPGIVSRLLEENSKLKKFYPKTMQGTGPVREAVQEEPTLGLFNTYEEAYHQLIMDLVALQVMSLKLLLKEGPVKKAFVSGGFVNNEIFLNLLAASFPKMSFYISELSRATALGAALVMHSQWNIETEINNRFHFKQITPGRQLYGMMDYQLI